MKRGNVILSTVALVVTAGAAFGFKAHKKAPGAHTLWTKTTGSCVARDCFTTLNSGQGQGCADLPAGVLAYTAQQTINHGFTCANLYSGLRTSNQ